MEFLPSQSNGEKVYAGLWIRFCALFIDSIIMLPLGILVIWSQGFSLPLAIATTIFLLFSVFYTLFRVFFNVYFGGTPGKLAVGIRITKPNGSKIGWSEAWMRSAVDILFSFLMLIGQTWALTQVDPERFLSSGWIERSKLMTANYPSWFDPFQILQQVWFGGEVLVLLLNERKRAIHDFIAGTVVIRKNFVAEEIPYDPT